MAADKSTSWLIKLIDKVTAPLKSIDKIVKPATDRLDTLEKTGGRVNSMFSGLGRTLATIGIAASVTALTQKSIEFEHSMAMSNTIMKETPGNFAAVTDQVRDLSKEIPIVRDQLSSGLYEVLSAGVPKENAIQFLEDSAKAAVAGTADLGEVVRTTTSIIKAYGMEFDKQADIQNRMQKAVDLGQMTMGEFASALPHSTVLAGNLGVTIDELMGAFATMTGVTGNAAEVSTQLAAVMSGLINPSSEARDVIKQLGIAFDANSVKRAGGLNDFLTELMPKIDALSNRSGMTRQSIIAKLFGREEAVRGIIGLTGELADKWSENTIAMTTSAGAVESAFNVMQETTQSKILKMQNNLTALWDKLYLAALPVITWIIDNLGGMFDWLSKFRESHPYLFKTIMIIAAMGVAIWAVHTAVSWATGAWTAFMTAVNSGWIMKAVGLIVTLGAGIFGLQAPFWAATSSTWAFNAALYANPIGLIILAVISLIALIVAVIKKWDEWGAAVTLFMGPLGLVISMIQSLRKNWEMVKNAFSGEGFLGGLKALGKVLLDAVLYPIEQLVGLIAKVTGADWATDAVDSIRRFRDSLGVNTGQTDEASTTSETIGAISQDNTSNNLTPLSASSMAGGANSGGDSSSGMDISGSAKAGAIVNQKITFNLDFSKYQGNIKQLTDEVVARITDQLSDATIMAAN